MSWTTLMVYMNIAVAKKPAVLVRVWKANVNTWSILTNLKRYVSGCGENLYRKGVNDLVQKYECMHINKPRKVSYRKAIEHCLKKGCQLLKVNFKKRRR